MSSTNALEQSFIKSYSDKTYQHTAMVNHRGTVISFAMDVKRRIYYAVLDIGKADDKKGPLDVKYWVDNPQTLPFPNEIKQVGYAILNPVSMPIVKKGTGLEADANMAVSLSDADTFLSSTARLTANAPFQVFSDNQHIYVFRQSLAGDHADMVHKLKSGGSSGAETDITQYVTDQKVPLVADTLLVDRFILAGTVLNPPREVRFRRSKNKSTPASAKDSLGAKDMEGKAFYEPTQELDFIRQLSEGRFSVILLPTQVADIERWQIFAYNKSSKFIDSFNIERDEDGFFNLQGTQLYTSPDSKYKTSVLERKPGNCPFTGLPLVPNDALEATISTSGYAGQALQFDGTSGSVTLPAALSLQLIDHDFTVEAWVNSSSNSGDQMILGGGVTEQNKGLHLGIRDGKPYMGFHGDDLADPTVLANNTWYHLAFRYTATTKEQRIFVNGNKTITRTAEAHYKGTGSLSLGRSYVDRYFSGELDEVRIWNIARSAAEIKQTLNRRLLGNELGLAGYWRFDEATGNTVTDLSTNGYHGTLSNTGVQRVNSGAPIGAAVQNATEMQINRFAFADRDVAGGLSARLYYQQEKQSSETKAKSVKQNARVLLAATTTGPSVTVPISKGLMINLSGESYLGGNQWDDLSGKGNHAFTTYGSAMPSLHQVTNYHSKNFPVIRFVNGPSMKILPSGSFTAPFTAIIVDRYTQSWNADYTLASAAGVENNSSHWHLGKRFGKNLFYTQKIRSTDRDRVYVGSAEAAIVNVFSINTGTIEGDQAKWYLDGVSKGTARLPFPVDGDLRLGGDSLHADVACVLVWDRVLSDNERQIVEKWLGAKYGINISHSVDMPDKKYVAALDVAVSQEGRLAQLPETIPLNALLSANLGGLASEGVLGEISGLEGDIPRLGDEITRLGTEISALTNQIASDEREVATLSTIEGNVSRLEGTLADQNTPRMVTFYEHSPSDSGGRGRSLELFTGDRRERGNWWNHKISDIQYSPSLVKIEVYKNFKFEGRKWTFPGATDFEWKDKISSIKVFKSDSLKQDIINTQSALTSEQQDVTRLKDIRDTLLPLKRTQKIQKSTLLQTTQQTRTAKNARLSTLRLIRFGVPKPQQMTAIHTDSQGLTASSGLLGFARTDSQPYLFESALGRMALYFKGENKQFFSAYYDINTARARWLLATTNGTTSGSLSLVSRATNSQINATRIAVADGGDADHCQVTISNAETGLTETWNKVPREVHAFAQVLNGNAGEKNFIGKLNESLLATAITSINLKESLPREVPAGSTVIIDDGTSGSNSLKLTVTTLAASGTKQIAVSSATPTFPAFNDDTKVYLLHYDYAANASSNRTRDSLSKGNLQVDVVVGSVTGKVNNITAASPVIEAQDSQWIADAPGSAFYFDGGSYFKGEEPQHFQHEGALTLEAWVRPFDVSYDQRLIHCTSGNTRYALWLQPAPLLSALSLDGDGDAVLCPTKNKINFNQDFTVEAWVKLSQEDAKDGIQPIFGQEQTDGAGGLNKQLHLVIRDDKPYLGFYDNDLADPTVLTRGIWYHLAFRYTAATKEQAIFVNGDETSSRTAPDHYQGTASEFRIGHAQMGSEWYYLQAEIDEVRIWNIARDIDDIKADRSRRLGGQEPGLAAYYYFEQGNAKDRSGNGHHGIRQGNLISRPPVASPLKAYICYAEVGNDTIVTTTPTVTLSWHHFAAVYQQSYALKFDGTDFADAGNEAMLNITEDLTIEAFVKLGSLGHKQGIVSKGIMDNGGGGSVPYAFYIDAVGKLVLEFEGDDGTNYHYSSSSNVSAGTFTRIAVVRKIGKEKIEKTGTTAIKYKDNAGVEQTRDVETIESVGFQEFSDVRFYINDKDAGYSTHNGKKPIGNRGSLFIGQTYIKDQEEIQFVGQISEIRIWNVARLAGEVNSNLTGAESGLAAWWRFEENSGNIAYDTKGGNHARLSGTQWVKTPDPDGSSFIIYQDGQAVPTTNVTRPEVGDTQFTLGACIYQTNYVGHYRGSLEEVRIWKTARRQEEILDNLFTRLKGEKKDLIANYSFDDVTATEVKDSGLKTNHLRFPSTASMKPVQVLSTAPISNDTAQVRSAVAGIKTDFHAQISGRPAVAEYADMQRLEDMTMIGVHKRCYAYIQNGKWILSTGYKVGNLITEWIGQAQFAPQVTGYIEGAPPVPSENLTEGYYRTTQTFNGTSEVTINESEMVSYSVSSSKESGFSSGFEMEAELGLSLDPRIILAPLGIGMSKKFKFSMASKFKLSMEANGSWSGGESFGSGQTVSRNMSAAIGGNWDVADNTKWANPELTRRFIPANMGFAFVESKTTDVYALRLEHNGALVAFRMLPNPDIPKDTNIIPFPINNRYTKQGTLDGRIGYTSTKVAYDPDYANAKVYGEYSYFKPKEAYELKKRIEREAQRLKNYYDSFTSTPAGAEMMGALAAGIGSGAGATATLGVTVAAKLGASVALGSAIAPLLAGSMIAGGMGATIGSLIAATTAKDEDLPDKYARRNIANTYVWTADGGFYEESTQISEVSSESKSGSYSFSGKGTGGFELEVDGGIKNKFGLNGMLGGSLNLTKSKSEEASNSFSIDMKLLVPDNLQRYEYNTANDTSSGVKGVYDNSGSPVNQPGKVDAFRFMTFHLEPSLDNFEDLFGKVIDPIWLEESQHPNAIALREANQDKKKPKCWRVFHRVTFVSRILPDFSTETAPSLEKKMKNLNIASNYELVRRLDPYVRDHTDNFIQFQDAVKSAVKTYLPELSTETELNQITLFLADYYGVSY